MLRTKQEDGRSWTSLSRATLGGDVTQRRRRIKIANEKVLNIQSSPRTKSQVRRILFSLGRPSAMSWIRRPSLHKLPQNVIEFKMSARASLTTK
jgi:hypothetical protein